MVELLWLGASSALGDGSGEGPWTLRSGTGMYDGGVTVTVELEDEADTGGELLPRRAGACWCCCCCMGAKKPSVGLSLAYSDRGE